MWEYMRCYVAIKCTCSLDSWASSTKFFLSLTNFSIDTPFGHPGGRSRSFTIFFVQKIAKSVFFAVLFV